MAVTTFHDFPLASPSPRRGAHDDAFHLIDAAASRQGVSIGPG
jgi:hypothetical protein